MNTAESNTAGYQYGRLRIARSPSGSRDIEDKRARQRAKQAGRPKNERSAPGKLVEGATVQGWNAAYGPLAGHGPDDTTMVSVRP